LVVDDEPAIRRLLVTWLEADGFDVLEAETGGEAVELARTALLQLIIMDINLPDMTGFSATERIRASREFATVPIICMTGLDMGIAAAHEGGCTDLLLKPIERAQFLAAVRRHVKQRL
jgi:CheY-like chemotaxis protein